MCLIWESCKNNCFGYCDKCSENYEDNAKDENGKLYKNYYEFNDWKDEEED